MDAEAHMPINDFAYALGRMICGVIATAVPVCYATPDVLFAGYTFGAFLTVLTLTWSLVR